MPRPDGSERWGGWSPGENHAPRSISGAEADRIGPWTEVQQPFPPEISRQTCPRIDGGSSEEQGCGCRPSPCGEYRIIPDSPDGPARCRRRAPIFSATSTSYAEPGSRILMDATGESRILPFRQRFRAPRACRPNPNGESGSRGTARAPDRRHGPAAPRAADAALPGAKATFLPPRPIVTIETRAAPVGPRQQQCHRILSGRRATARSDVRRNATCSAC